MTTAKTWEPFGIPEDAYTEAAGGRGQKILSISWRRPKDESEPGRRPGSALVAAGAVLLALLAGGLFVVSLAAQYHFVLAEKHEAVPAVIEAVALDVGMAIFSLLALGLAMAGQPARTERGLIIACAAGSAAMNYAAANDGSPRSVAAYVVPPVFLAIVVDRVVAVVRRHVTGGADRSAWAGFGRVALYVLRFVLAAPSTATGLRRQVLILTPLPDAALAAVPAPNVAALPAGPVSPGSVATSKPRPKTTGRGGRESKRALLINAYEALARTDGRIGDRSKVSEVARELAPDVGLEWGSARTYLYRHLDAGAAR